LDAHVFFVSEYRKNTYTMKKSLTLFFFTVLAFGAFAQNGCNNNTPAWGANLGTITFDNRGHNAVIHGNGISQVWSGAVTATNCQKATFRGGSTHNFHADCRSNPGFPGDLFSWCAVVRFADELCPYPWRVPSMQDFIYLDVALGGNGQNRLQETVNSHTWQMQLDWFTGTATNQWNSAFGGISYSDGSLIGQNLWASYWSLTYGNASHARSLYFRDVSAPTFSPQDWRHKSNGLSLRCVRDTVIVDVTGVTLYPPTATLLLNNRMQLIATVLPANATNQNVTWSSSDNSIATVNSNGLVTAVALGSATITVTTEDGGHTATSVITVSMPMDCNDNTPGWGASLGEVYWGTIGNTNIEIGTTTVSRAGTPPASAQGTGTQVWSGHVFATACAKGNAIDNDQFDGGVTGNFNADCRQTLHTFNVGRNANAITGDFFSWCAVMRFADELCPYPWRVPTSDDFRHLHWILLNQSPSAGIAIWHGNTGAYMPTTGTIATPTIGGTWGGVRFTGWAGNLILTASSVYWSSTEVSATSVRRLDFGATVVILEFSTNKASGLALRCVR